MAKLELPVRAFVEDFVKRSFPNRDWGRGSAINDLVIKAFGGLMQPTRHEIDVTKVNQSLANWKYMRQEDLDALAANWGKFRQRGGKSVGTVRIYFDAAQDYQFNSLSFYSTDGSIFTLSAPVTITATDLFQRRLSDGTFYFDVTVESVGVGSRYALPAGSIVGVQNRPPGVVRVENPNDFAVTAPDESNFDVVNSMFKNLGLRNLVSRQSIRAPLLDTFPGIVDLFIAGAGHPNMVRDLVDVTLSSGPARIHMGGMTDIWLNTTALSKQQLTLSYLPSSKEISIVSSEQAQANELIFAFTRGLLSIDGEFMNPDLATIEIDESGSIEFDVDDIPVSSFVVEAVGDNRVQVGQQDLVSGQDMVVIPGPNGYSPYVADLTGLNLGNTAVRVGDYTLIDGTYRRIVGKSGTVLDLGPYVSSVQDFLYDGADLAPGTRVIPLTDIDDVAKINDRLLIPSSAASGYYNIVGLNADEATIARIAAAGEVTYVGVDPELADTLVYEFTAPGGGRPMLPFDVGTSHYLYFGTDAGYDQLNYFPIVAIEPGTSSTIIKILDGSSSSTLLGDDVQVIAGLTGTLASGVIVTLQRDVGGMFPQTSVQVPATIPTVYANTVDADLPIGTNELESIGIGALAQPGDIIHFTDMDLDEASISVSGGDGTRFSVVIVDVVDLDTVAFRPPLPAVAPKNSRFAVMRNSEVIDTLNPTSVSPGDKTVTFASVPPGIGDGIGFILRDEDDNLYVVTNSTAGNVRTLKFVAPVSARSVTLSSGGYVPASPGDRGRAVQQVDGVDTYNGVLYDYNNATRTWIIIPNGVTDTFASTTDPIEVTGSTATGTPSAPASAPANYGYTNAVPTDVGKIVRQGVYMGILDSYDNGVYEWSVKPIGDNDLFDSTALSVTIDSGTGTGKLSEPASELELGSGSATFVLNDTPLFVNTDDIAFLSRNSFQNGMFDGENFTVSTQFNTNPFDGVVAGETKLAILIGDNVALYDISRVDDFSLRIANAPAPAFIRIPNAPAEQAIDIASPMPVGTTTFSQENVGRWAHAGRCIKITTSSGPRLFVVASVTNDDSVELETGIPFAIYPTSGFSWEVVDGLVTPYWLVPAATLNSYRIFRTPDVGDILHSSSRGSFSNGVGLEDKFSDNTVDFSLLLANADFTHNEVLLYIDSGSEASTVPLTILSVPSTNTLEIDGEFTSIESNISYRIVLTSKAANNEFWVEAEVVNTANPKLTLHLINDDALEALARYGSIEGIVVHIKPHPAWVEPMAWTEDTDWTMPHFTIASWNSSTRMLELNAATDTYTDGADDAFDVGAGILLDVDDKVRLSLRLSDRAASSQLSGQAVNTYNYYSDNYFQLPIIKITDVQVLDPSSLQPIRSVPFSIRVDDSGLRYSAEEKNTLVVEDDDAVLQPLRVSYVTDSIISSVDNYVNADDTRVLNCNQLAKAMETFSVSVDVSVRTTLAQAEVASIIASYINNRRSTVPLSKADIIKDLFDRPEISYVDLDSFTLSGVYYKADGTTLTYSDVSELYGSDTARYLSDNISVTKI